MKTTKALIKSISTDDSFTIEVPNYMYEHNCGTNLNKDFVDIFCDLVEDSLPNNNDWNNGYTYKLMQKTD